MTRILKRSFFIPARSCCVSLRVVLCRERARDRSSGFRRSAHEHMASHTMHTLRWYDHQKETRRDSPPVNHSFLPFGGATFPLSSWKSNGVPSVRADGSPAGYGETRHVLPNPSLKGFFVPQYTCAAQRTHLKGERDRFEPTVRPHTGRGGGVALSDHRTRTPNNLKPAVWNQPAPPRKVFGSTLTQIHRKPVPVSIPVACPWHQLARSPAVKLQPFRLGDRPMAGEGSKRHV